MSNSSTLDALRALQACITSIAEKSRLPPAAWVSTFEAQQFRTLMTYTENGVEHFVTLGHLTPDNKVDWSMHESLFMLENDTDLLKRLVASAQAGKARELQSAIDDYALRVAIGATLLRNYLELACKNIEQKTFVAMMKQEPNNAAAIGAEAQRTFLEQMRALADVSEYFRQGLARLAQGGHLKDLPLFSMVVGYRVADGELLNIYMTRDHAAQMREWLGRMQARAFSEPKKEAAPRPAPRAAHLKFQYRQKRWPGLVLMLMFGSFANFSFERAQSAAPGTDAYVEWALFGVSMVLALFGAFATVLAFQRSRHVTLDERALTAPKHAFSRAEVKVPFDSITRLRFQRIQKQLFLHIEHKGGKLVVPQSLLPSPADFEELCKNLTARVPAASLQ